MDLNVHKSGDRLDSIVGGRDKSTMMALRAARQLLARPVAASGKRQTRKMGGGGEPGTLFGEKPGQPMEGWEPIIYSCYAACGVLLLFGLGNKPTTSINSWAKEEAAVRLKLKADGEELEYGVHYANRESENGEAASWSSYQGGRVRSWVGTVGGAFKGEATYTKEGVGIAPEKNED